ncbi:MAG: hypothetical protein NXI31_08145 [bacterium]|nr:hypothetical protein [bacterium]
MIRGLRIGGGAIHVARTLLVTALGAGLLAQGIRDPQEEWRRAQRRLQQNRAEVDRLVDMRFRHDLGLPAAEDPTRPTGRPMSTLQKERMLRDLRDQEGQNVALSSRFNDLRRQFEELRQEAVASAERKADEAFVVVPSAGTARPQQRHPMPAMETNSGGISSPGEFQPNPGSSGSGLQPLPAGSSPAVQLTRVRGQIRGSDDHLRVAQSLFKAGQALMDVADDAREEGDVKTAESYDQRAKERLERAIAELEPLLAKPAPEYAALFCKGRCLELLFRHSERYDSLSLRRTTRLYQQREQEVRDAFLAISARDVKKTGENGTVEVLGSWGMAANAAVEHFRWLNLHGAYQPVTPIAEITWPGEKDK